MKDRIVWLMIMVMCAVLSSPLLGGVTPGPNGGRDFIESFVPGSIYLDFVDSSNSMNNTYVRPDAVIGDVTCVTSGAGADNWGWPDTSDDEDMANGDFVTDGGNDGDAYDSKEHTASDFIATISGLEALAGYQVYVKTFHDGTKYGQAWGVADATENVMAPNTEADGIWVDIGRDGGGGSEGPGKACYLYLLREETVLADAAGEMVLHFARGGDRTQYDGVLLVWTTPGDPTFNPAPVANAGADQATYIGDTVQLEGSASDEGSLGGNVGHPEGIQSSVWYKQSGPGTANFSDAGIMDPTVTFDAKGVYELVLQVSDIEPKDGNDIVVITVKDHADEFIVGHWPLDGDALDYSINSNDGTLEGAEYTGEPNGMPEYTTDAAVGSHAIDLSDNLGLEAIDDHDPNMKYIDLGAATELDFGTTDWTVSTWVKTTTPRPNGDNVDKGTLFGNGADNGGGHRYCLIHNENETGKITLITDDNSTKYQDTRSDVVNDGLWHLIVAQRDGTELRIYRDGILDDSQGISAGYDLSGTSSWNSYIGVITDNATGTIYKHLDGQIDDVRVYNYALPLDDATYTSILDLAAMGPIVASVDAGGDFSINWKPVGTPPAPLAGSIVDNGISPVTSGLWSTVAGPDDGLGGFEEASFTDAADPLSTVTFPAAGVYTLKLEVFDADAVTDANPGGLVADTVVVTVIAPTCADVILDSLLLKYDFNGDCYVGLEDFVVILNDYLKCNDPLDPSCPWPF